MKAVCLLSLAVCLLPAQERLAFDAASVKPSQTLERHTSVHHDGGSFSMIDATLKYCIERAYGVADSQVSGPGWLETERFDIVAKAADDAKDDRHLQRLQTLLAERFHLQVHREKRETSVFALVLAKNGPKLTEIAASGDGSRSSGPGHLSAKATGMDQLALFLSGPRAALGRPVVNATGLDGVFNFELSWAPDDKSDQPSIFTALQEQLGLRLESRRAPVEILIVDHVEKIPTEN